MNAAASAIEIFNRYTVGFPMMWYACPYPMNNVFIRLFTNAIVSFTRDIYNKIT